MDKKIKYNSTWTFKSENIAKNFNVHVKQSVPLYDETQRMIVEIAAFYLRNNDCMLDIGCSTGTTILRIKKNIKKKIEFYGIDDSAQMLEICKENLKNTNAVLINQDLNEINLEEIKKPLSLATSLYCLQFLNLEKRINVLRNIYQKLRSGGALIIVEKIRSEDPFFNEMMLDLYSDMKIRNGLKPQDNIKKSNSLRGVMCPVSIDENKRFLLQAGFSKIDIFFKWHNFVGIIAEK